MSYKAHRTPIALRFMRRARPSTPPAANENKMYFKADGFIYVQDSAGVEQAATDSIDAGVQYHGCTLRSGTSVTTSDVTAATHVYVTPHAGNQIALYDGSAWANYSFSEIDIDLAAFPADKNYDVFAYDNGSGTVIAETVVWTNDTTRATALVLQDGIYVKSGTTTKRYIGTIRTTSTIGQTEDSLLNRYVWSYYNRIERKLAITDTTNSWTYATATWRSWNNSAANRASFVLGVSENSVKMQFLSSAAAAGGALAYNAIGLDSTSSPSGLWQRSAATSIAPLNASYSGNPSAGFHYLQLLEYASAATITFYGDNGGLLQCGGVGSMWG